MNPQKLKQLLELPPTESQASAVEEHKQRVLAANMAILGDSLENIDDALAESTTDSAAVSLYVRRCELLAVISRDWCHEVSWN